jgi:ATP-dependent DNA helicase 2 subunit 1
MLTPPPASNSKKADKDSPLAAALKCAYQIMQQRIISNPKDMMGVLLYGTEKTKFQNGDEDSPEGMAYPHCYLLIDLDVPAAQDVKALRTLVDDEEEAAKLLVPTKDEINMSNVLFCANQIFATKAPNFGSRRLFIITDKDDPHASDKALRSAAAVRAKDLYDLGVIIELFPISRPDHDFDRTKFYDDIIYRDPSDPDAPVLSSASIKSSSSGGGADGISLLQSLISNINSKQVAKRALFSNLPFEIGPGFKISVKGYNILQAQKPARQSYIWLDGEKAQIAVGESTQFAADASERSVQKTEIKKAYKFGGEQVLFSRDELKQLKSFGSPVLRILGFKPRAMLPVWAAIDKSTFIYPSEEDYVGSTRVFAALWAKLLKDELMGVAWYIARSNAKPVIVAVLPSAEILDPATKQQSSPAGLWLYPLPFADDCRSPPDAAPGGPLVAPDPLIDAMRLIVEQLQLPGARYDPARYPNPVLQWHYRILQAIALEEEVPEFESGRDDKTVPKYRQIDKRAGEYVLGWGRQLERYCSGNEVVHARADADAGEVESREGDRNDALRRLKESQSAKEKGRGKASPSQSQRKPIKREADADDEDEDIHELRGHASKRARSGTADAAASGSMVSMTASELRKFVDAGKLSKVTVVELRDWLHGKGLDTKGVKALLIERVEEWIETH